MNTKRWSNGPYYQMTTNYHERVTYHIYPPYYSHIPAMRPPVRTKPNKDRP